MEETIQMATGLKFPPQRRKRGTITKRLIMDTAAAMFHEKGYDRSNLDDIAKMLSITKPSLYYYFSNKEEILLECVTSANLHFQKEMALRDDVALVGRRRAEIFLRLYLEVITNDVGVSMVVADDRVMSTEARGKYNKLRRVLNSDLEDRLKLGMADGSIKTPETRLTTYAIFGMFNWVGHWNFRRRKISVDKILERFLCIIFEGIGVS